MKTFDLFSVFLTGTVILNVVNNGACQPDMATLKNVLVNGDDAALLEVINEVLSNQTEALQAIRESVFAALPLLQYDSPQGSFRNFVLPWMLKHLPDLIRNEEFSGILGIFVTELNQHNITLDWIPEEVLLAQNKSLNLEYIIRGLFNELDLIQMALDILRHRSFSDFFPYTANFTDRQLNEQCYSDTMAFIDRLLVGEEWALDSKLSHY